MLSHFIYTFIPLYTYTHNINVMFNNQFKNPVFISKISMSLWFIRQKAWSIFESLAIILALEWNILHIQVSILLYSYTKIAWTLTVFNSPNKSYNFFFDYKVSVKQLKAWFKFKSKSPILETWKVIKRAWLHHIFLFLKLRIRFLNTIKLSDFGMSMSSLFHSLISSGK